MGKDLPEACDGRPERWGRDESADNHLSYYYSLREWGEQRHYHQNPKQPQAVLSYSMINLPLLYTG